MKPLIGTRIKNKKQAEDLADYKGKRKSKAMKHRNRQIHRDKCRKILQAFNNESIETHKA